MSRYLPPVPEFNQKNFENLRNTFSSIRLPPPPTILRRISPPYTSPPISTRKPLSPLTRLGKSSPPIPNRIPSLLRTAAHIPTPAHIQTSSPTLSSVSTRRPLNSVKRSGRLLPPLPSPLPLPLPLSSPLPLPLSSPPQSLKQVYSSSTLNDVNSYKCNFGYVNIKEMYEKVEKSRIYILRFILREFQSCVEDETIINIYSSQGPTTYSIARESILKQTKCNGAETFNQPITIYPVVILFEHKISPDAPTTYSSHYNIMICDHVTKEIEHYEPNGYAPWLSVVDNSFRNTFKDAYPTYKFVETLSFCPNTGPQQISTQNWCVVFSLLYILIRLKEPSLTRNEIIDDMMKLGKSGINSLLTNFICFLYGIYKENFLSYPKYLISIGKLYLEIQKLIHKIHGKFPEVASTLYLYIGIINAEKDTLEDLVRLESVYEHVLSKLKTPSYSDNLSFVRNAVDEQTRWVVSMYPNVSNIAKGHASGLYFFLT